MLTLTSEVQIWAHRLPAGVKLAVLAVATTALFRLHGPLPLAAAFGAVAVVSATGGPRFAGQSARILRPLWPFVLMVGLWHLFTRDIAGGAEVILRMTTAVAAANFVTMTTRLADMQRVLEWLCRPLAALGLPPARLALALALVIRFIPVLQDRAGQISAAWSARSARRAGWRTVAPLTAAALDDAAHVADALRARGGSV
ncbi:CbiQ family ECF transporter T component [Fuscibacter oryzae]|uniref:Energy-coupling factor transporter transmembrane protein EcfT n=1 Tax=Fuscibacter oryzae TaxID=2803939 RepID=A0A8J7STG2_9RHOB|nr:CbiQ family ECF transporter T component [Fuscibacter oryzae]MBL4926536.1 energy-coupling factor transporter transmembrane protein EcfT [Fuscibacter oryzae]